MGANAELIAIGKYTDAIKEQLDYPAEFYSRTQEGVKITTIVIYCNTTNQSELLADALGFNLWDFNKHYIKNVDFSITGHVDLSELFPYEYKKLLILKGAGFDFIFLPNG